VIDRDPEVPDANGKGNGNGNGHGNQPPTLDLGRLGDYKLLSEIARGGMGIVYRARQIGSDHEVALKAVWGGQTGGELLTQRFLVEVEATAELDHPNIVPVYGSGEQDGWHYFTMKLIEGESVADLMAREQKPMSPRVAAGMIAKVARAVQYAHERGILHRDLKPSNLLLDRAGHVYLTDFGLAKLTDESSEITRSWAVLGTPSYMPPEQAAGQMKHLTTVADVYGLGAVLYELLTGNAPFRGATPISTLRMVMEDEPQRPSLLNPQVESSLETICLKCLEKDAKDRYGSAAALADDLDRWLGHKSIKARPLDTAERIIKWARRRPAMAAMFGIIVLTALVGFAGVLWQWNQAVEARRVSDAHRLQAEAARKEAEAANAQTKKALEQSEEQRQMAEAVGNFMVDAFRSSDPSFNGRDYKVSEMLDQSLEKLHNGFKGSPMVKGALLNAQGQTYLGLGLSDRSISVAGEAVQLRQSVLGPDHRDTLLSVNNLALANLAAGRYQEALSMLEDLVPRLTSRFGPDNPNTLAAMNGLAETYHALGRVDETVRLHETGFRLRKAKWGLNNFDTVTSMVNLGNAYKDAGRLAEGLPLLEEALKLRKSTLGADNPATLSSITGLGVAYQVAGRFDDALPLLKESLERRREKLGPQHPVTLQSMEYLAALQRQMGNLNEAIPLLEETVKLRTAIVGPNHPNTLSSMNNLALAYQAANRLDDALPLFIRTVELAKTVRGLDHPQTQHYLHCLAGAYQAAGRPREAVNLYEQELALRKSMLGPTHPTTLKAMVNLSSTLERAREYDQAAEQRQELVALTKEKYGAQSVEAAVELNNLGHNLLVQKRHADAELVTREALAIREKLIPDDWRVFETRGLLGAVLSGKGGYADAEPLLLNAYDGLKQHESGIPDGRKYFIEPAMTRLVQLYKLWKKPAQAAEWQRKLDELNPAVAKTETEN
jgi:tetratricopeptide (TPR) repeat protein